MQSLVGSRLSINVYPSINLAIPVGSKLCGIENILKHPLHPPPFLPSLLHHITSHLITTHTHLQSQHTHKRSRNTRTNNLRNRTRRRAASALRARTPRRAPSLTSTHTGTRGRSIRPQNRLIYQTLHARVVRIIVALDIARQRAVPVRHSRERLERAKVRHVAGDAVGCGFHEGGERGVRGGRLGDGGWAQRGGELADFGGHEVFEGGDVGLDLDGGKDGLVLILVGFCCSLSMGDGMGWDG